MKIRNALMAVVVATAPLAPAAAQPIPWIDHRGFGEPLYLVRCQPTSFTAACYGDGLALVPDPTAYPHVMLITLGGPFNQRWQVENMRASLVRQGMPSHAMQIIVLDRGGRTLGGFWMGAKPVCHYSEGQLSGQVNADLSRAGHRPEAFPVTEDAFAAYMDHFEQLRRECTRIWDGESFGSPSSSSVQSSPSAPGGYCSGAYGCTPGAVSPQNRPQGPCPPGVAACTHGPVRPQ